jgi:hypothetical protein
METKTNLCLMAVAIMAVLIGTGSAWADLTDGLVAHWKLDGDANDSAGSNHGTIYGATPTTGQIGDALDFDGDDGVYIEGSAGTGSVLNIYNSNLTISAWVKPATVAAQSTIVARWKILAGAYRLGITNTGNLFINTYLNGPGHWYLIGSQVLEVDTWYYVIGVFDRDAGRGRVYVNGVETAGTLGPAPLSNDAITRIGCRQDTSDFAFDGAIDDVRIYNRALPGNEIRQLYGIELESLEIVGPDEVAENSQVQYKAIAMCQSSQSVLQPVH